MSLNDTSFMLELDSDPLVMRYINGGQPSSVEDIFQRFIPRYRQYLNPEKGWGLWGITANKHPLNQVNLHDQFLGWILIRPMGFFTDSPNFTNIEIGWRFKRIAWGKGIATAMAANVIDIVAERNLLVNEVSAIAVPENTGSIAVMKRLGMCLVKETVDVEDNQINVVVYSKVIKKPIK
ncbi:GNAT family N-acetyltransferase [Shewanella intestini]|nr:GNAT family N-acetyltransferase [Shewanella intestini]